MAHAAADRHELWGLLAEFDSPATLLDAARRLRDAGYRRLDAYSPFPIEGLGEAVGFPQTRLPLVVLISGLSGAAGGYGLQYWVSVLNYPHNVGGRPLHSWPAFIPVAFECTILAAALAAVIGMLILNGLPRPHHPLFNVPAFALASRDRFFLSVEARDDEFDRDRTRQFLDSLRPQSVYEVEP